jgi:putative sigma-54 modulation protein
MEGSMEIHFTARKFKAHETIRSHAIESVRKMEKYYDGVVRGDIVLSYEKPTQSVKTAEVILHVHGTLLSAKEHSEDFHKSIDLAVAKVEQQLKKYKTRLRGKDKKVLRRTKESDVPMETGDDE